MDIIMEKAVRERTEQLVGAVRGSDVYQNYRIQKAKIDAMPEIKAKIDDYRVKRYDLQNITDESLLFDKMEEFEREYEDFEDDPIVNAFLQAELDFCRTIQEINRYITENIDFSF